MSNNLALKVADVVRDAGGRVVGRTKLQKMIYLLMASGLEQGFPFVYKHYGPYSEQAAEAVRSASLLGFLDEKEDMASWGGFYSVYTVTPSGAEDSVRRRLLNVAASSNAVELELAATALFLFNVEKSSHPWQETERRKPDKAAHGRLEGAKALYNRLRSIDTPVIFPELAS